MTDNKALAESKNQKPRAIIVGAYLFTEESHKMEEDLDELESLLVTLGYSVVGRVFQRRQKFIAKSLLGSGKVNEIRELAQENGAKTVVFDRSLTGVQVRNLEKMTDCEIFDRTGIILEIFSKHARTNQAKTQVEIAKLEYLLPRLSGAWTHFQRQTGGGVKARGMGEKQIEIDRRRARERIARLHKKLDGLLIEKRTQRKARSEELKVSLVGYTNSGKTTLMSNLTRSTVEAKDELFATLDTSIKIIDPKTRPKILLSDTVGFIRDLPHSLIESFKSTLDEVKESDLLLIVVDVSHPSYRDHIQTTIDVLEEIDAGDIPKIIVFNKCDLLDDPILPKILVSAYNGSIVLSAHNDKDVTRLRSHIYDYFKGDLIEKELLVPINDHAGQSMVFSSCLIVDSDYSLPGQVSFQIKTTKSMLEKLIPYVADKDANREPEF